MTTSITTIIVPPQSVNTVVVAGPQGIAGAVQSLSITSNGTITVTGNTADKNNTNAVFNIALPQSIATTATPTFARLTLTGNLAVSGTTTGITSAMVGLGNVNNTADSAKPVSTAQQTALNLKANIASPTFTGTVSGITAAMVGLGNVTNESKTTMFASPTFTGTVSGVTKAMVGLGNVDNTADTAKPISTATQTALDAKQPLDATLTALAAVTTAANTLVYATGVDSFATTAITDVARTLLDDTTTAAMRTTIGLGNVTNESKATMFASPTFTGTVSGVTSAMTGSVPTTQLGVASGVATLDSSGVLNSAQIPPIAITNTSVVASEAAMLALTAQTGDVAVRSDLNASYILKGSSASTLADWQILLTPTDNVLSVAGRTGVVVLAKADVGLGNVDNTSDASKPVSTAQQTALNLKANLVSPTFTTPNIGVATGTSFNSITGLSSTTPLINGTAAVGTGTTAARADHVHPTDTTRAPLASPTFTGTVSGITKAMVGLGSVDNTADTAKPISTAQAAGLVAKTSATGSAVIPSGTTAQRDASPVVGYTRFNSTLGKQEVWNGTAWVMGGGATGGGSDDVFYENSYTVTTSYTISTGKNAMSAGPININDAVTITIPDNSVWTII